MFRDEKNKFKHFKSDTYRIIVRVQKLHFKNKISLWESFLFLQAFLFKYQANIFIGHFPHIQSAHDIQSKSEAGK